MTASNGNAPDLIARLASALEQCDKEAVRTRSKIWRREIPKGTAALQRIHETASDALAELREATER